MSKDYLIMFTCLLFFSYTLSQSDLRTIIKNSSYLFINYIWYCWFSTYVLCS